MELVHLSQGERDYSVCLIASTARGGFSSVLSAPTMHRQLFSEQLVPTVCPTGCEPLQGDGVM